MAFVKSNTRGIRNNNPFNIVKSSVRWYGQSKSQPDTKFVTFDSLDLGMRAGVKLLRNYITRVRDLSGERVNTVAKILYRFAPVSDGNDTELYIKYVVDQINYEVFNDGNLFTRDTVIDFPSIEFAVLCKSICFYESQYIVPSAYIYTIINQFKLF